MEIRVISVDIKNKTVRALNNNESGSSIYTPKLRIHFIYSKLLFIYNYIYIYIYIYNI